MQNIWKHVLAVVVLFVLASDARPSSSDTSSHAVRRNKRALKEKIKKKWTKKELDSKTIDVDSELFHVLEGMAINGKRPRYSLRAFEKGSNKAMGLEQKFMDEKTSDRKGKDKKGKGKAKRNFITRIDSYGTDWYWPNGIVPYYVDYSIFGNYATDAQERIQEAADDFEAKTCVRLVNKTMNEITSEGLSYWIKITSSSGCWSYVGRAWWKENVGQELNLQSDGCLWKSTIIHEFCHALGMQHEQSRSDRDNHLRVLFENIQDDKEYNLHKKTTLDNNPYDYYSLMQYSLSSFVSKSWAQSMEFRDPDLEFLAGGSPELSFYDVMDITKAYECSAGCQQTDDSCKNGGFIDHNCKCYCPEGLKGTDCNTIASDTCGGVIDLQPGQDQIIQSPNYPNNYDTDKICYWLLRAQNANQRIMIEVNDFDLAASSDNSRCYHWLELRYNLIGQPSRKNCGNTFYTNKISSTEYGSPELMMLVFDTATITGAAAGKGFSITARAVEIGSNGCSSPPTVAHSSNNYATSGSSIGAIVRYECDDLYHMVGSGSSVTCQADGTWSNVGFQCNIRVPVFQCDFENGDCGVSLSTSSGGTHNWGIQTENGNSFFTLSPTTTPTSTMYARFTLPNQVDRDKDYCLSFKFKRTSALSSCAYLYVGETAYYNRWRYYDCNQQNDWEIFKGDISPWYSYTQLTELMFTSYSYATAMNMQIDDILLSEGFC